MRLLHNALVSFLSLSTAVVAAGQWSFEDATLSVQGKGSGVGGGEKEKLSPSSALASQPTLHAADSLKIVLTTTEGKTGKKPHQAFLTLTEPSTGLQESFPFSVKDNGKAKVDVSQKDLPYQLLAGSAPLKASISLASFGSTKPLNHQAFELAVETDASAPPIAPEMPERYTPQPEIHHIFGSDPQSPPKIISLVFTLAIIATFPALLGGWVLLGGNLDHMGQAFGSAPVAHGLFLGSILAMEGTFFLYYTSWNLFQTLPVMAVAGVVAVVSGSRALTEVQERRLKGLR